KTNLEKDGIHIEMETDLSNGCFVSGKESEIFEVLINLIKNAAEAMPEGGLIRVKTSVVDDQVVLEIEDTGTGISDENMKRIFEPFWSTKGDMGTGMGLSVTHGILSSHGGEITVASKVGEGTKFTIKLPLAMAVLELSSHAMSTILDSQLRILLVDDIAPLRTLLHDLLICHGHTVLMAESGMQALDLFRNSEFDLVICDLGMPEMSGWEVGGSVKKICWEKQIPKTPFLLLTGWGGQSLGTERIEQSGIDGILEKPVNIPKLFETIRKVVYEREKS
ncbi:MAG: ATP-binding protein, partial [Desulfomonilaceae bacterium]